MFKISIDKPDFAIDCGTLKSSKEVYKLMKEKTAGSYGYTVRYKKTGMIIKIGQSSPSEQRLNPNEFGERLARQASNLPGWPEGLPDSVHGADLYRGIQKAQHKGLLPPTLTKDDVIFEVWNLSDRNCDGIANPRQQSTWCEGELAKQYKSKHLDNLPILNVVDPCNNSAYKKSYISRDVWNNLFEEG